MNIIYRFTLGTLENIQESIAKMLQKSDNAAGPKLIYTSHSFCLYKDPTSRA